MKIKKRHSFSAGLALLAALLLIQLSGDGPRGAFLRPGPAPEALEAARELLLETVGGLSLGLERTAKDHWTTKSWNGASVLDPRANQGTVKHFFDILTGLLSKGIDPATITAYHPADFPSKHFF